MPVLEFPVQEPITDLLNIAYLQGIMAYPEDSKSRDRILSTIFYQSLIKSSETDEITIPVSHLKNILSAPPVEEIKDTLVRRIRVACVVGRVVQWMVQLHLQGYKPSLGKALWLLEKSYKGAYYEENKRRGIPMNERTFKKYWRQFKSVAHLYAAFRFMGDAHKRLGKPAPFDPDYILIFLKIAETFRRFLSQTFVLVNGVKTPLVDEKELWKAPEGLSSPDLALTFLRSPWLDEIIPTYKVELYGIKETPE
jgi:hypothetical protein